MELLKAVKHNNVEKVYRLLQTDIDVTEMLLSHPKEMEVILSPDGNWNVISEEQIEDGVIQYTVTFLS